MVLPGSAIHLETVRRYVATPDGVFACGKRMFSRRFFCAVRPSGGGSWLVVTGPFRTSRECVDAWQTWLDDCKRRRRNAVSEALRAVGAS